MSSPAGEDHGDSHELGGLGRSFSRDVQPRRTIMGKVGRPKNEKPEPGMEWVPVPPLGEPPKKKQGRPRKSSVPYEDTSDGSPKPCRCDVLAQKVQKPHTVVDYLEEFLDTEKRIAGQGIATEEWFAKMDDDAQNAPYVDPEEDPEPEDDDPEPAAGGAKVVGHGLEADRVSPHHYGHSVIVQTP
ncbi:hypothetical protein F2Q68_00020119 [Brassica cretica]|uniref:Uncharacterized protein n=1 Tax=Brassica cretica TaxID=69181 RepID=A0A8S9FU27_BRACR|nr:hypothetical protein F2Q68_00020119 [Brassica cretica]